LASVRKTNRAVVACHGWPYGGPHSEIIDQIQYRAFDHLDAPLEKVTYEDIPMSYAENLEHLTIPDAERIRAAIARATYKKGAN
jgi:pyruvate dehydrogenase E1 component beta subunit